MTTLLGSVAKFVVLRHKRKLTEAGLTLCDEKSNGLGCVMATRSLRGLGTNTMDELDAAAPAEGHDGHENVIAEASCKNAPSLSRTVFKPGTDTTFMGPETPTDTLRHIQ